LTENPDVTVGVIEAGKYRIGDPNVDIPVCPILSICMGTSELITMTGNVYADVGKP
jgi:hypothetical protein